MYIVYISRDLWGIILCTTVIWNIWLQTLGAACMPPSKHNYSSALHARLTRLLWWRRPLIVCLTRRCLVSCEFRWPGLCRGDVPLDNFVMKAKVGFSRNLIRHNFAPFAQSNRYCLLHLILHKQPNALVASKLIALFESHTTNGFLTLFSPRYAMSYIVTATWFGLVWSSKWVYGQNWSFFEFFA